MPSTYDIGDLVTVTGRFTNSTGGPADPTTITFLYDTPTSTVATSATRPGSSTAANPTDGITRVSAGVYTANVTCTGAGLYETRFTSTGLVTASGESWFSVRRQIGRAACRERV